MKAELLSQAPYYFNIAENMDATITPTSFSGRGQMLEAELRYKTQNSDTEFELANMDKDDITGKIDMLIFSEIIES